MYDEMDLNLDGNAFLSHTQQDILRSYLRSHILILNQKQNNKNIYLKGRDPTYNFLKLIMSDRF